jgi:hypothetical protein
VQADKAAGYAGVSLNAQVFSVQSSIGTIVPAPGGSTTYGPNMFFLSALEESHTSNKYTVYEIPNSLASGFAVLKTYKKVYSDVSYTPALTAYQPGGIPLLDLFANINDYVQNAFYENGVLQFCQNTNVNGRRAVYLGRITGIPNNISCTGKTISDPNLYFSYASIAYAGTSSSDNSAIVAFEHTGAAAYPALSAVYVNSNFEISRRLNVKAGQDTINGLWGDYSGICRRYNHPGEVWYEGQYGSSTFPNINWIAKLKAPVCADENILSAGDSQGPSSDAAAAKYFFSSYPNPLSSSTTISYTLPQSEKVVLRIFDLNGTLVKTLIDARMQAGTHQLIWDAGEEKGNAVSPGIYLLRMQAGDFSETEKLVIVK